MDTEIIKDMILLVDDNVANLKIGKNAFGNLYDVSTAPSAERMFSLLEWDTPSLILLDVDMPEVNGYEALELLKKNLKTKDIPVIFLTGKSDSENEIKGLSLGAVDYISKPFLPELLRARVANHLTILQQTRLLEKQREELKQFNENLQQLISEKTKHIIKLHNSILKTVADLVEGRDCNTGGHIERTQKWLEILMDAVIALNLYPDETKSWDKTLILRSSQLHDVGKISISDTILQKPGKLTDEEFNAMKNHTIYGAEIIDKMGENLDDKSFLEYAKTLAISHHEKWDGSGYPNGLENVKIPLIGRLMAIADVYDALTSERVYKAAFSREKAANIIIEGSGTHFDPVLVQAFIYSQRRINDEPGGKWTI